jgi:hypothetical protein
VELPRREARAHFVAQRVERRSARLAAGGGASQRASGTALRGDAATRLAVQRRRSSVGFGRVEQRVRGGQRFGRGFERGGVALRERPHLAHPRGGQGALDSIAE